MAVLAGSQLVSEEAEYTNNKHQVRRVYQVKADSALEAQVDALSQTAPTLLTALSANTRYSEGKKSRVWFNVEITYGTPDYSAMHQGNPLDWDPKISYPNEAYEEPYFIDTTNKAVVNSALQPFDDMKPRRRTRMVIQVELTMADASFDPLVLAAYADTTNGSAVTIDGVSYGVGTLLMTAPQASAKLTYVNGSTVIHYRTITLQLLIDPEGGWKDRIADTGYDELIGGKWVPITDEHGQKVTKAYPLDGAGRKSSGDPATIEFTPYYSSTWSGVSFT